MIDLPLERNEALLLRSLLEGIETNLRGSAHPAWYDGPIADELKNVRERLEKIMFEYAEHAEAMCRQAAIR